MHTVHAILQNWQSISCVIKADVRQCFDSVNQGKLLSVLRRFLGPGNEPLVLILKSFMITPVFDCQKRAYEVRSVGIPQGSQISPLLMNLYLDSLDRAMESQWVWGRYERYADDILIGVATPPVGGDREKRIGELRANTARRRLLSKVKKIGLKLTFDCLSRGQQRQPLSCLGLQLRISPQGSVLLSPPYSKWKKSRFGGIPKECRSVNRLFSRSRSYLYFALNLQKEEQKRLQRFLASLMSKYVSAETPRRRLKATSVLRWRKLCRAIRGSLRRNNKP